MPLPTNILQTVQTYQDSALAYLDNLYCFINTANKKFKDFENKEANLGDTVTFDLPPKFATADTLVASFQGSQQRVQSLTVNMAKNVSYAFSNQQFVFNVREYMEKFGKSAVRQLATTVEADVAKLAETNTYRFYGDGTTAINSFQSLATALAYYRNYGAVQENVRGYISDISEPSIVGSGLTQFVQDRNEEIAYSWKIGRFSDTEWHRSNLLPVHTSGTVGNAAATADRTLTVVSTNDGTGANITQIVCTTTDANDVNAIKAYDLGQFIDGVSGKPDVRFMTFIGQELSANPCQIAVTANATSAAGSVTINITPALCSVSGQNQNINTNIVAGMKILMMPSHRCGLIQGGGALYLAMPRLPEETPFPTANKSDAESGVSLRMYYGSLFGQNQRGFVNDVIWGKTLVPEYAMRLLFPL